MFQLSFAQPLWLLLLLLIIPAVYLNRRNRPSLHFPAGSWLKKLPSSPGKHLRHTGLILRLGAFALLVLAMARPQYGHSVSRQKSEALDIMLVVDTSRSMLAMDFKSGGKRQNRLDVSKLVLREFIGNRTDDRLGLTIFGTQAFAWVPMTLDHDVLLRYLDEAETGMAGDSTAIGDALGVAVNRLKDLKSNSKIIILLTDGANQAGSLDPLDAARAAQALGVRIYTIGVGSNKPVPFPTEFGYRDVRFELDEGLLKEVASITRGRYFRANNTETLSEVYKTIDKLEKTENVWMISEGVD